MAIPAAYRLIHATSSGFSTGTQTVTLAPPTLLASLLVVFVGTDGTADTVSTVTDNAGNTYIRATGANPGAGFGNTEIWYARNAQPTSSIVVTFSGATSGKNATVYEYGGMLAAACVLDKVVTASGTGTTPATGFVTTIEPTELLVSNCSYVIASANLTVGAGWGNFFEQGVSVTGIHGMQDFTQTFIGLVASGMTGSSASGKYVIAMATFVIASGGTFQGSTVRPHPYQPGMAG